MATRGTSEAFMNVCDRELDIEDFYDVYDKINPLSAHWKQIAISLRLRINTINTIEAKSNRNIVVYLQEVLECWLKKDYDHKRHGIPCWRRVCVAVKDGGSDSALADEIAREHPLVSATTGGATPHPEGAGSTASIPTSSIYVPKTVTDFKLHRELSEIQEEFAEAIQETIEYYPESWLPKLIDYITARISTLLGPHENTPAKAQAVRKEFNDVTTIKDFFGLLQDKYTSWFKHEPITKLVYENDINGDQDMYEDEYELYREFEDDGFDYVKKAKRSWSRYEERLDEYFKKCVKVADPASYGITDAPPGKQVIIVKVDRGNYNQNDLYFLRKAIPSGLDKPDLKVYLCQVLPN